MVAVDVTVPLFDKRATVRRAVDSVLAQSFGDLAVRVVDDGSTDGGAAALAEVRDPRLTVIRQDNCGPGPARNRGVAAGEAPLLAFLDADDEWAQDHLARAVADLAAHPGAAASVSGRWVGPDRRSAEDDDRRAGIVAGTWRLPPASHPAATKRRVDFCHSSCVVVRRPVFDRHGGFYDRPRCLYGEDSYLWLGVLLDHEVHLDPRPTVWFHTEDSALGRARRGRHPRRPALDDPEPLRSRCDPTRRAVLEDLLAYYRLLETEALVRRGETEPVRELRAAFPWPHRPGAALLRRELKVDVRRLAALARRGRAQRRYSR
jgi:glycosyltransferase involved in cell wall biosynthesis